MALPRLLCNISKTLSKPSVQSVACLSTTARLSQSSQSTGSDEVGATEEEARVPEMPPPFALDTPAMTSRKLQFPVTHTYPRLAWVESMDSLQGTKMGMLDLHPDVFAVYPRIDVLKKNVHWQRMYRHIDYSFEPSRAEMPGGGRKPWPQKGLGKARHGSNRSPLWVKGAKSHGPRGPTSYFYMLPRPLRTLGLRVALSCKYAQDNLVIVDSLEIPTSDPEFMSELADVRFWGYSVLLVDDTDEMPNNIAASVGEIRGFNLMPVYGLNVYSMLKHETLVLTLAAVEKIERKLLEEIHSTEIERKFVNNRRPEDFWERPPNPDTIMRKKYSAPLDPKDYF